MNELDLLKGLIEKRRQKNSALEQVAGQQVTGQPWRQAGDTRNPLETMMGRGGTPAENRARNQIYSAMLNRQPGQTRIGAATQGFERGSQLIDEIRQKQHNAAIAAAQVGIGGMDSEINDRLRIENQKVVRDRTDAMREDARMRLALSAAEDARKRKEAEDAARAAEKTTAEALSGQADEVLHDVRRIKDNLSDWTSGTAAGVGRNIWGTDARAQESRYESLKSKLAIGKLQEMRAAAANGASGFGQLTKNEFEALMSAIDSLDQTNSVERQREALDTIEKYYVKALQDYASVLSSDPSNYSDNSTKYLREAGVDI